MSVDTIQAAVASDERPTSLWRDAWHRLARNRLAVSGLVVIVFLVFVAATAPSRAEAA